MNGYAAFFLPARREAHGSAHIEAVLAGVPILWSRKTGIDGLFEGLDVGIACDSASPRDVTEGLGMLVARERELKREIARLQAAGAFEHLRQKGIGARYRALLARATGATALDSPVRRMPRVS
jgi:hypothetical protein